MARVYIDFEIEETRSVDDFIYELGFDMLHSKCVKNFEIKKSILNCRVFTVWKTLWKYGR